MCYLFFFKQKTAYEMRISDWSSDVCSSDLVHLRIQRDNEGLHHPRAGPLAPRLRGEKAIHNPRCRHDSDQRETPRSRMQNAFCHVGLRSVLPCWYRPVVRFLSASRAPARCSANAARDVNVISVWEATTLRPI